MLLLFLILLLLLYSYIKIYWVMNDILQKQFFLNGNFTKKERFDDFGKNYENKMLKLLLPSP